MDADLFFSFFDSIIRRGPDGDMIGFNTQMVQHFLNRNADGCTAPPYGDNKTGLESAFENTKTELK